MHRRRRCQYGFLNTTSAGPLAPLLAAFHRALNRSGYVEGGNVAIEYRWAEGRYEQLPALAADLVGRNVAIVSDRRDGAGRRRKPSPVPSLFCLSQLLTQSRNSGRKYRPPGGNATGVGVYAADWKKRLELLRDLLPNSDKISMLVNPDSISTNIEIEDLEGAARVLTFQLLVPEGPHCGRAR